MGERRRVLYSITVPSTVSMLRGQLDYLDRAGFEVHLACEASPYLERVAQEERCELHDLPLTRSWLALDDLRGVRRAIRLLREVKPDVLNYSTPKASLIWAVASHFWRPRFVVYLLRGLRLENERRWSLGFWILWLTELIASRSADVVVCVSDEVRAKALDLRLVRADHAVVLGKGSSNGVNAERFRPSPDLRSSMREQLGFADSDVVVGFVGRFVRDKGLFDLLDALPLMASDVRCMLIGDSELDDDIMAILAARRLLDRVTVVDYTHDIRDYYAAMDIVALPTHREGMPNVLLEAQAMALPSVTTDATGCRNAIAADETALVVPVASPTRLAQALDRLALNPELRARLGAAGRRRVLEHFRHEDQCERYLQLYTGHRATEPATVQEQPETRGVA